MADTNTAASPSEPINPTPTTTAQEPVAAPVVTPTKQVEEPQSEDTPAAPQPAQTPASDPALKPEPTASVVAEATRSVPTPATTIDPVAPVEPAVEVRPPVPAETAPLTEAPASEAPQEPQASLEPTPAPVSVPQLGIDSTVAVKALDPTVTAPVSEPTAVPAEVSTTTEPKFDPIPAPISEALLPNPAGIPTEKPQETMTETPAITSVPEPLPTQGAKEPTDAKEVKRVDFTEAEEPQNPLTERFTSAEWKALKEFRASLPKILEEAYPDDPKASTKAIKLWGIEINPQEADSPKDARVSVVLMKFLRARNLNPSVAKDMLVATLRWRDQFNIDAAMKETYPDEVFGQLGHVYGKDKEGRPVVYNLYGANKDLKAVFGDVQRFLRWRVKLMEESIALLDFVTIDQTVQIHDYEGVSLSSRDANSKQAASEASSIFQSHYPELLHRKFFINVPSLLNWIFWLFKPLISANTLAKMSVVGSGSYAIGKALLPVINKDQLPKRYGGDAEAF